MLTEISHVKLAFSHKSIREPTIAFVAARLLLICLPNYVTTSFVNAPNYYAD